MGRREKIAKREIEDVKDYLKKCPGVTIVQSEGRLRPTRKQKKNNHNGAYLEFTGIHGYGIRFRIYFDLWYQNVTVKTEDFEEFKRCIKNYVRLDDLKL